MIHHIPVDRITILILSASVFLTFLSGCELFSGASSAPSVFFETLDYMGITEQAVILVNDFSADSGSDTLDTVAVRVFSINTDITGETIVLQETEPGSGYFSGSIGFERLFTNEGQIELVPDNGRVGVYADGGTDVKEEVTAVYVREETGESYSASAWYQEPPSTVSGIVKDTEGTIVPGAAVRLYNSGGTVDITVGSRSDGVYALYDIPSGIYTLEADKDNYQCLKGTVYVP